MSSEQSLKQPADEATASDKPTAKKAKLTDVDTTTGGGDAKNGIEAKQSNTPSKSSSTNGDSKPNDAGSGDKQQGGGSSTSNNNNINMSNNNISDQDVVDIINLESGASLDPKISQSLEQVQSIQSEIFKLNEKASEEILKVEQKFNQLRRPHFEKRNSLLKEVPNFWLNSLANHPVISNMVQSQEDEDCLHYLVMLDVEEFEDIKSGYRLKLHFKENPYITNEVIVKEFQIVSSEEMISSSTPIEYKSTDEGKNLKNVVENSIAQFRRSRDDGLVQQSFFAWLSEPSESGTDDIAEILKDQIYPNPLEFFFAQPEEYDGDDDDEEDDSDEEDGIEDEVDDDDVDPPAIEYSDEEIEGDDDDDDDEDDDVEGDGDEDDDDDDDDEDDDDDNQVA